MAKSKKKQQPPIDQFLNKPIVRILFTFASTVISTVVLALSALTIMQIYSKGYQTAPQYLIWVFIFVGLMNVVFFLKERTRLNLIRCILLFVINVGIGVATLFAVDNAYLFSITAGLYCLTIVISRAFEIIKKHNIRSIILNSLIIAFAVFLAIGIFSSTSKNEADVQTVITVECVFIAIVSFLEAARIALASLKVKVLTKIVVSTFSLEIIFGLLTMIVCFSIVLTSVEPAEAGFATFPDALWYCFAVVTTIGFGDIVAVTPVGRIITVILGLYGLIVVAVLTSIIVNFYNETVGKKDAIELRHINKEEQEGKD